MHDPPARRGGSVGEARQPPGVDASGARGDLARCCSRRVGETDRRSSWPIAVDVAHLRHTRSLRRPRTASRANRGQGQIVDAVSIRERPAEAAERAIPGHWEGDLLAGAGNSHVATLVERHSRFLILVAVDGKDTRSVTSALSRQVSRLPQQLRSSLTRARGMEMAEHARFTVATDVKVYFCDPQSPRQRGSNENTNGLLRQYPPKGTDLSKLSQPQLDAIAAKLNTRPRQTLDFTTPAATLNAALR